MNPAAAWTNERPEEPGFYELWDPQRGINRIVQLFVTTKGQLAVRNFCRCKYAFLIQMWDHRCFRDTHWRGPIHVPDGIDAAQAACLLPNCGTA